MSDGSCPACGCPRKDAARGECRVPMPIPQPADCLMVTLESEEAPHE